MALRTRLERLEKRACVQRPRRRPENVEDMTDAELCEVIAESTRFTPEAVAAMSDEQLRELVGE
jgi:hypothetical protein